MSADNGVYLLESPTALGRKEYRVAECQSIEDLTYKPEGFPGDGQRFWNLLALWHKFGQCKVFLNESDAWDAAREIHHGLDVCEYGIGPVILDRIFPTRAEVFNFAMTSLRFELQSTTNDDTPVPSRLLYQIRFALVDVLELLGEGLE
jgi:hypothetical protein